jgi:hypothetical protein
VKPRQAGLCAFRVSADPSENGGIALPAVANIDVMGALSWSPSSNQNKTSILFNSTVAGQVVTAYKTFDSQAIALSRSDRDCDAILNLSPQAGIAPALPDVLPASTALTVQPVSAGMCTTAVTDQYARFGDPQIKLSAQVMGDLSFAPSRVVSSIFLSFTSPAAPPKTLTLYKTYDNVPIVPVFAHNGCVTNAGFNPQRGIAPKLPSSSPAMTRIVVRPTVPGTCTVEFLDQYGANERPVTVTVTIGPAVASPNHSP